MPHPIFILIGWLVHLIVCFYLVRFIPNTIIRLFFTMAPCVLLTYLIGYDLPPLHMPSMLLVTFCWLASIRFVHLTVLSPNQYSTFRSFALKFLWMFFPIIPCPLNQQQQWPILYDFISAGVKLVANHWMYRWLLTCEGSDGYARMIMFYIFSLSYTFLSDVQSAVVRIVTRDKYMLQSLSNFAFLSHSLRDFWGRRYNQLVGAILRESVFRPLLQHLSSTTIASLIVFLLSGLLHVHLALVTFKDSRATIPTMMFFILHGIACSAEAHTSLRLPTPLAWLVTHLFLLATAHLQIGPFTRMGPEFYAVNTPPLLEQKWIPKLPVPKYCPN